MRAAVRASKGDAFGAGFVPLRYRSHRAARMRLPQFGHIGSGAAAGGARKAASVQNRRLLDRLAQSLQIDRKPLDFGRDNLRRYRQQDGLITGGELLACERVDVMARAPRFHVVRPLAKSGPDKMAIKQEQQHLAKAEADIAEADTRIER